MNIFVFSLLLISAHNGQFNTLDPSSDLIIDRAWWTSAVILICFHATDIPMFDSRVNMLCWILLIGLRCISIKPDLKNILVKES